MPHFRFKIVKTFKDSLSRQVAESVRIDMRDGVINSKAMYSRNRLPRLEVEKPEWERNEEERRKKLQEWKQKENWDLRTKSQEEKDRLQQVEETENMMTESWREGRVRRVREMDENEGEMQRSKKRRRGHYNGDTQWGLSALSEEDKKKQKWLSETCTLKEQECKDKMRQSKLQPWSGTMMMCRDLVLEVVVTAAERIERRAEELRMNSTDEETNSGTESEKIVEENVGAEKQLEEQPMMKEKKPKIVKPKDLVKTSNHDIC